jgi:hypothetical protein
MPLTPEMLFKSGSLVKQFTAISVIMLLRKVRSGLTTKSPNIYLRLPLRGRV